MESESNADPTLKKVYPITMPGLTSTKATFLSGLRYEHLMAGLTGGVVSTLVTHPFDLIKLRFAVHDGGESVERVKYRGVFDAFRSIARQEGFTALYRGASANVVGAGLSWGLYFFFYNAFKFHFQDGDLTVQLNPLTHMLIASSAGILTLSATNPVWVVKTRLCLVNTSNIPEYMRYRGLTDGLVSLYKHEGFRGLYKGFIPGVFGTSHGAIQFMVYEEIKKGYCNYYSIPITTKLGSLNYIVMAALSKFVAASTTYPYQVVRARLQDQEQKYSTVTDTIKRIWRYEGIRGYYKGLAANLAKVVPATCLTFVVYEHMSRKLIS